MRYTRRLISFVLITFLVGLGSLMLSTGQVRAGDIQVTCNIEIVKEASPADDTEFDFPVTGGPIGFILMDPDHPAVQFGIGLGEITITETVPQGWQLDGIECSVNNDNLVVYSVNGATVTIDCLDSVGIIECVFTNTQRVASVPTLSQWGLIATAGILGIVGFMVIRRRKVTA